MMNLIALIVISVFSTILRSEELHLSDSHGPISIMGDHFHKKGEMMFSYRFGQMKMNKIMNGTKILYPDNITSAPNSASNGKGTYMNTPISMGMNMHMFGAMYAPYDSMTLMLMSSFLKKEMKQKRMPMAGGNFFDVNSEGFGDTRLSGIFKIFDKKQVKTLLGLGLSFPSGSIDLRGKTPTSFSSRLGYSMQNGSGTLDNFIFINNVKKIGRLKVGERVLYKKTFTGKNVKGYKYGELFEAALWSSYSWKKNLSSSVKIDYSFRKKMNGSDNEMNPRMSPAMDSYNQGYQKLNIGFGVNLVNHYSFLKNNRIGIEGIFPIFQRYRGLQMRQSYRLIIGWQYSC